MIETDNYNFDNFEIFTWSDQLLINHDKVDDQHKKLVVLLNGLAKALVNDNNVKINQAFTELGEYANYHFLTEEEYWTKALGNDPWFIAHQEIHNSFLPQLEKIKGKETNLDEDNALEEVVKFLINWLAFHIIDSDKRMAIAVDEINNGKNIKEAKEASRNRMNGSLKNLTDTILTMYDGLSNNAIKLMKERRFRIRAEEKLRTVNAHLKTVSITDSLTGLYNRRHFNELCKKELKRATREKTPLSLIEIDIDFFKRVNDSKGHQEGDRILERLGLIISEICRRPGDFSFRLGGEEFAILLVNEESNGAKELSEKLSKRLFLEEEITLSCGVVSLIPDTNVTVDIILGIADKMLYKAKETGRNKVVVHNEIVI